MEPAWPFSGGFGGWIAPRAELRGMRSIVLAWLLLGSLALGQERFQPPRAGESGQVQTALGLSYTVLVAGQGQPLSQGERFQAQSEAWLADGTRFFSTLENRAPLDYVLGSGTACAGFDLGVMGMRVGEVRRIYIPARLAFGEAGRGRVPPDSDLVFEVEVTQRGTAVSLRQPPAPGETGQLQAGNGLTYTILRPGQGEPVQPGERVRAHYTGWLTDGRKFDSSLDRGQPFEVQIGVGQVIPGWDQGSVGMRTGEIRRLYLPPELGYGARGAGATIPPNAALVFEVELIAHGR